jgi:hypothetical protein
MPQHQLNTALQWHFVELTRILSFLSVRVSFSSPMVFRLHSLCSASEISSQCALNTITVSVTVNVPIISDCGTFYMPNSIFEPILLC